MTLSIVFAVAKIGGVFPLLCTPYTDKGELDCATLAKEAAFVADCGADGVIWPPAAEAITLLSPDEERRGLAAIAGALDGRHAWFAPCCPGTNTADMLRRVATAEAVAAKHPGLNATMLVRMLDDAKNDDDYRRQYDALAAATKLPVIIQTYNGKSPMPSAKLLIELARRHPQTYGWYKVEGTGAGIAPCAAELVAAKPAVKTVFTGWGGRDWLHHYRRIGTRGVISQRPMYADLMVKIWRALSSGDGAVDELFAKFMYLRNLEDAIPAPAMRGWNLYAFQKRGVFTNALSREAEKGGGWVLKDLSLSAAERAEVDARLAYALGDPLPVPTPHAAIQTAGAPIHSGSVHLKGRLGDRLDSMIARHVAGTDVDYITAPFIEKTERRRWWQTEFWGKYMHSAMPYLAYSGSASLGNSVERGLKRILDSQEPCGYIGNYPDELRCGEGWDVWGMKYTMMGLMHYYDGMKESDAAKANRALDACKRLCDYVIGEIGPNGRRGREVWQTGNWAGYASSSILEPVMWLYKRTNEKKYLDFATFIVKGMEEPETGPRLVDLALKGVPVADRSGYGSVMDANGGYVMKSNRQKAYEMMSCYQGLLEYWEVTGRKDLLEAAVLTGRDIVREEVNLAGGCASSERWFHGARKQHIPYEHLQETCVTTTWMRFCEKLLDLTDDTTWADQIERTFYNAYLGALKPDGSVFAAYTPLSGLRNRGMDHCFMHIDCCTANGPRGFLCFLRKMFCTRGDAAVFNFYATAQVRGTVPSTGREVAFDMYSLYPREGMARIVSHVEGAGVVPLKLRVPGWCAKVDVTVNGESVKGTPSGGYFVVSRDWRMGDVIEIRFDMPVVAHVQCGHVAFTRGPVLLARDSRFNDGDLAESFRPGLADGQRMTSFAAVAVPSDDFWMTFSAVLPIGSHYENPEMRNHSAVMFCDYASAGSLWRRDNFYRTWFPVERRNN